MSTGCCCGSNAPAAECCDRLLAGERQADTAEALMRSRYAAFVRHNATYLENTWHPDTRPARIDFDPRQRWLGLKIVSSNAGAGEATTGEVEFIARYKINGRGFRLHEHSRFARVTDRWFYLDGTPGCRDTSGKP